MQHFSLFLSLILTLSLMTRTLADEVHDIVIYGGTSAGIIAGIQARLMGKSVVVIEPSGREGGLTTGGLGQTDIGNKHVIGGLSRSFYERIARYYADESAWEWQNADSYKSGGQSRTLHGESTQWTFEPSAALKVYRAWIQEVGLRVVHHERLDRDDGVMKKGNVIQSIRMESGRAFAGRMFLDATYEGDLMASVGVRYTVGREAVDKYQESLNGVQTRMAKYHQFMKGVDPYRIKGDPGSGLLPFIDPMGPGVEGAGDMRLQAYCFRMCLTDHPENRIPFHKPAGYNPLWYELLLRNFEAGERGMPWIHSGMPNRKTDTNNRTGFSTDFIGQNHAYPEASYVERERMVIRHRLFQQGLMWTLANHPRVPDKIRNEVARWGMCRDEFVEGNGWQKQLYIREARRMVSDFVMTQNHCQQKESVSDSIGMGAYTMDSHHVQRYVNADGFVQNEGDVEVGGFPPYPISFRSMIPRRSEAENLLVPICLSASHMAFGSIRMEPVFMVLGQSAATVACLALDAQVPVQEVHYSELKTRLEADDQILNYGQTDLDGIIVDDSEARLRGNWKQSAIHSGYQLGYKHDGDARDGQSSADFFTELPESGEYAIQISWLPHSNRATNVPVKVHHSEGLHEIQVNQRTHPKGENGFHQIGTFNFHHDASVIVSNEGTDGFVVIDAVRWIKLNP
ncbi:FAD-dependent oxidoreductase [Verrucomicrobia bacterium]|nr:FAD-dependent oxidoreductase [Verrucomicrobiota bacterium]